MKIREGYNVDVPYIPTFREIYTPIHMDFVLKVAGYKSKDIEKFNYLELGCGSGQALCIMSALYPNAQFYGIDFMQEHIDEANEIARKTEIDNVKFYSHSFQDFIGKLKDFPMMDFVIMHGVYSWVGDENRKFICDILEKIVKPGGLVYVSYNAMPGNAATAALQQFLMAHSRTAAGTSADRVNAGMNYALSLSEQGAGFFDTYKDQVVSRIRAAQEQHRNYAAHEFLNEAWCALPFSKVANDMSNIGLTYAGSSQIYFSLDDYGIKPALLPDIQKETDVIWRETLIDFARNTPFRADIYIKGGEKLTQDDADAQLEAAIFTLNGESYLAEKNLMDLWGLKAQTIKDVMQVLEQPLFSLSDLFDRVQLEMSWKKFLNLVRHELNHGRFSLARDGSHSIAGSRRLNRYFLSRNPYGIYTHYFCAPHLGKAVPFTHRAVLVQEAWNQKPNASPSELVKMCLQNLEARGQRMQGSWETDVYEQIVSTELGRTVFEFKDVTLPMMKRIGISETL